MKIEARVKFDRDETKTLARLCRWTDADFAPKPEGELPLVAIANGAQLSWQAVDGLLVYVKELRKAAVIAVRYWSAAEIPNGGMIANGEVVKRALVESRQDAVELCDESIKILNVARSLLDGYQSTGEEDEDD